MKQVFGFVLLVGFLLSAAYGCGAIMRDTVEPEPEYVRCTPL